MKDIFAGICHLEVEYEITGQPKRIDFYMEETCTPINEEMDYLKVFSRYNLVEFKSEGDIFQKKDITKTYAYMANFLSYYPKRQSELHYILVSSILPKRLFQEYKMEEVTQGIYKTEDFRMAPLYSVVISELPPVGKKEVEKLQLFLEKNKVDSYLEESINNRNDLSLALLLYRDRIFKIARRLGISMTAIEERAIEIGKMFGMVQRVDLENEIRLEEQEKSRKLMEIRERRERRHNKLRTALNMRKEGFEIPLIVRVTELPEEKLVRFFRWIKD